MYIDGHWDLRPVKRWPHNIIEDDLKAVISDFLTATARVSPNLNPHAHCHDTIAPFSSVSDRINDAGSFVSGFSMRCTSTPPCLLARQKKARSAVAHRGCSQTTHCSRFPVICGLIVDEAGIGARACSSESCATDTVFLALTDKASSPGECSVASLGVCTRSACVGQRLVVSESGPSVGNASVAMAKLSLCSVAAAVSHIWSACVRYQVTKSV